jgi:hypothetical protein
LTYRFATVDLTSPFAPAPLATVNLVVAGKALGWPNRIVATTVGGRRFAIVVGGVSGQGRLAVVEVTDPLNPVVQAIVDLEGSWGKSVTHGAGGTVYVGTPEGLEAYSVLEPSSPKLLGVLPSVVTGVGEAMVANGLAVGAGKNGGLSVSALLVRPSLGLSTYIVVDDNFQSVDGVPEFQGSVVPKDFETLTAELVLLEGGEGISTLTPAPSPDGTLVVPVTKGLLVPEPAPPSGAQLVLNRGLGDETAALLDLYGNGLIRPLLSIAARPQFATDAAISEGPPLLRVRLDLDAANNRLCLVWFDRLFVTVWR